MKMEKDEVERRASLVLHSAVTALCGVVINSATAQIAEKWQAHADRAGQIAAAEPRYAILNINNLTTWMRADGLSNHSPSGDNGTYFPRGTKFVIYQDGLLWGGKAFVDSLKTTPAPYGQMIRVGGSMYGTGCTAGWIDGFGATAQRVHPDDPRLRIYRIRRDYASMSSAALKRDAAESNEIAATDVTSMQIHTLREQYATDWEQWPVELGAPFIDRNHNGIYDPPPPFVSDFTPDDLITGGYDESGISDLTPDAPADQVIWTVYNDLDRSRSLEIGGSEPLGLEVQATLWGYSSDGALGNSAFRRIRIINKGGVDTDESGTKGSFWIDSMYVTLFSDPDLGAYHDDVVGCDTLLDMGFFYNADEADAEFQQFRLPPPAAGYILLQGPRIRARGDSAVFDFRRLYDWKNLKMTAFAYLEPICPTCDPAPTTREELYRIIKGWPRRGGSRFFPFPPGVVPSPFPLSGDPVKGEGFVDGLGTTYSLAPGDRRLIISSGPFSMAPGDTQEVVFAFVAGLGGDRLSSITHLKFLAKQVRSWYPYQGNFAHGAGYQPPEPVRPEYFQLSQNYPNPFNGATRIDYAIPRDGEVRLVIHDLLGREVVTVVDNNRAEAGFYNVRWDGRDKNGRDVPTGIYFYHLRAHYLQFTRKLAVIR